MTDTSNVTDTSDVTDTIDVVALILLIMQSNISRILSCSSVANTGVVCKYDKYSIALKLGGGGGGSEGEEQCPSGPWAR